MDDLLKHVSNHLGPACVREASKWWNSKDEDNSKIDYGKVFGDVYVSGFKKYFAEFVTPEVEAAVRKQGEKVPDDMFEILLDDGFMGGLRWRDFSTRVERIPARHMTTIDEWCPQLRKATE